MYALLQRQNMVPREPIAFSPELLVPGFWGIDLETRGVDAADPESCIVGVGLANNQHCFYIDLTAGEPEGLREFLLASSFTAFNVMFDGAHLQALTGQWLSFVGCSYGLFKELSSEGFPQQSWSLESAQLNVLGWPTTNKEPMEQALKERGLSKADMWKLPPEVLAPYCASDADAAWQLWQYLTSVAAQHPYLMGYHQRLFLNEVRLLAEQQFRGIKVDQERLESCRAQNEAQIQLAMEHFLNSAELAHHIKAYNQEIWDAWKASEPPINTMAGKPSVRWQQWRDREAKLKQFNPNSKTQLRWLFFEKLGYRPILFTKTGLPSVSKKVLPALGAGGMALAEYNVLTKRRGYIQAVIEKSARDGLVHPQFNSVGTVTGRLAGTGGLNCQQMPKTNEFLYAWRARPGYKLIQADAEALEPTILAEFSKDKTLRSVYGPDAPKNDIYLVVGSKLPGISDVIRLHYDPTNPTPEGIADAKKFAKHERAIAKEYHLASTYLAGPNKLLETLRLRGAYTAPKTDAEDRAQFREVKAGHAAYWRIFPGVTRFRGMLEQMWQKNGGWIPSALGVPLCVSSHVLKDTNSRFCQGSGHQFLQLWIWHTDRLRKERGVEMYPWLVDNHDEMLWEAPEEQTEAAAQIIADALEAANDEAGFEIRIKGPAQIVDNMAEVKCEDYQTWLDELLADDDDDED